VLDHELPLAARILVRVRRVMLAEMEITGAIRHEHHGVFGERIVGMGQIEDAARRRGGHIGDASDRRLASQYRLGIRITTPAIHAGATALEKHHHPIRRGAPDEETVVRVDRAAGLAAGSQCVPAVFEFRERGKLCSRRLRCCRRSAGNKDQQQ
jgi:hypothetical protein